MTVALPYETGHTALAARNAPLLESLEEIGIDSVEETAADPGNTDSPLLFHLERGFGATEPERRPADESLVFLRSAGERGEAEAIAVEVARLLADGCEPEQIAIVVRDPARRGPLIASILESYGIPTALEAEVPASTTSVGGSLIALLEAVLGTGRAADLLRYLRGPSGISPGRVDWFERKLRRDRVQTAAAALQLWEEKYGEPPEAVARLREAAGQAGGPGRARSAPSRRRWAPGSGSELEARTAAAISTALTERAELDGLAPLPEAHRADAGRDPGAGVERAGRGPGQDRRPPPGASGALRQRLRRLPAGRRVPARRRHIPTRSSPSASASRSACSRATTTTPRSATSSTSAWRCRDGGSSSPTATATRTAPPRRPRPSSTTSGRLLEPAESEVRGRGLAEVVHRVADAPSETELARAIAAAGRAPTRSDCWRSPVPRTRSPIGSGPDWRAPAAPRPPPGPRARSRTRR